MKLESKIQSDIIKWLSKRPKSSTYKHPPYPSGTPDICHIERGKVFYLEVKRTKSDKARSNQKKRMKILKNAGAICKVVRSVRDAQLIISKTFKLY